MREQTVPRLQWRTLLDASADTSPEVLAALDRYFEPFAQPPMQFAVGKNVIKEMHPCLHCGEPLLGLVTALIGRSGFTWGLAHGEGHCRNCKWPARAHHYIKDSDGKELLTVRNFVLQYHPDVVRTAEERTRRTPKNVLVGAPGLEPGTR